MARVHGCDPTDESDPMNLALCRLDDSLKTVRCGYLWKLSRSVAPSTGIQGGNNFVTSKWSKRWFMLRADSCLYFSKRETDARPLGAIMISDCQVLTGEGDGGAPSGGNSQSQQFDPRLTFRLRLATTCSGSNHHPLVVCLATENQADLQHWVNAINLSSLAPETDDLWVDISRQRMLLGPAEFPSPDCRGFLLKLDGISKTWKRRYCILVDSFLILYTDFDATEAIATICLHGYRVQSTGGLTGSKRHAFELIPPDASRMLAKELKNFYFVAETETEKKRWLASLEYSMDRWMKMS